MHCPPFQPLRFWSLKERATRPSGKALKIKDDPTWAPAFPPRLDPAASEASDPDEGFNHANNPPLADLGMDGMNPPDLGAASEALIDAGVLPGEGTQEWEDMQGGQGLQGLQGDPLQQELQEAILFQHAFEMQQQLQQEVPGLQQGQHQLQQELHQEAMQLLHEGLQAEQLDQQEQEQLQQELHQDAQQLLHEGIQHQQLDQDQQQQQELGVLQHYQQLMQHLVLENQLLAQQLQQVQQQDLLQHLNEQQQEVLLQQEQQQPQQQPEQLEQQQPQQLEQQPLLQHVQHVQQLQQQQLQQLQQLQVQEQQLQPVAPPAGINIVAGAGVGLVQQLQIGLADLMPHFPAAAGVPAGDARGGLLVLTAAAFLSRQFLPPSSMHFSVDDLLLLMEECLGVVAVDVVKALTGATNCPDAAKGFWGSLFLGIMLSATAGVPGGAVERLVGTLWERSSPKSGVMGLQRAGAGPAGVGGLAERGIATAAGGGVGAGEAAMAGAAAAGGAAGSSTTAGLIIPQRLEGGEEEPGPVNRYSLREFVSAVVVLLRYKEMHMGVDGLDCQRLHDQLMQVKEGRMGYDAMIN